MRSRRLRCLNLGSGPVGRYKELLGCWEVVAVDVLSPDGLQPWRYCRVDAKDLPFRARSFDVVVAIEAFEHIEDDVDAMREVYRVLKPGGSLVITTPTHWTWVYELGRHGAHYYSRRALVELVALNRLVVDEVIGCGGLVNFTANLLKSWASVVGLQLSRNWWSFVDTVFVPVFWLASKVDGFLAVLPANWVLLAHRPPDA